MADQTRPPDHAQRDEALYTGISCIVQAPAGSGKTELLTQRFLKLLAEVDEPEQILAITFTRAATAEMRSRILKQLESARNEKHNPALALARKVLAHSEKRGWKLLEQQQRLNIQTIDSLCMRIAHEQPLLARMGGHLQPQEDARPLYDEAARRTLANLGGRDREIHAALAHLLQLRDNNLPDAQSLIAAMLAQRDQWVHVFPLHRELSDEDWDKVRSTLEEPFKQAARNVLTEAHALLLREPLITEELMALARYACENGGNIELGLLAELRMLPNPDHGLVQHWRCISSLLLTDQNDWRKRIAKPEGFPADREKHLPPDRKPSEKMQRIIQHLRNVPNLLSLLTAIRNLPPSRYNEDQWKILRDLFVVLRYAVAELRILFAEQNVIDFVELGTSALQVLSSEHPDESILGISERIQHLLVDEFQDTSRRQLKLLEMLVRAWSTDDRRTYFLVGDPMQSIYMFRQAEVELFEQVQRNGIQEHSCKPLQLAANFRSHAGVTEPLNSYFETIFSGNRLPGAAAVPFSRSVATAPAPAEKSVFLNPQFVPKGNKKAIAQAREHEANRVIQLIEKYCPRIERAAAEPESSFTVAVLARARHHLTLIAQKLRGNHIPYRAVEMETLAERQEVRDLLSLTRALLHPMDRVAWLSVLRAPWCGLALEDLHVLCGQDEKQFARFPVLRLITERLSLLSTDGQQRLHRTAVILRRALETRYQQGQPFASWIERVWHSLGGPSCLDEAQQENARAFFLMISNLSPDGIACLGDELDLQLNRLFAQPDPRANERFGVQLMTIHKAKGLGFDVVIVPGLERSTGRDPKPLISMLQRANPANVDEDELLVAPIDNKGSATHPLYRWVQKQRQMREEEERKRVFYVACTRARQDLHLFATSMVTNGGSILAGAGDSLLSAAWPALKTEFESAYSEQTRQNVLVFPAPLPGVVDIAATAISRHPALKLWRLPSDFQAAPVGKNVPAAGILSTAFDEGELFERPEGSRFHRITGSMIHALLEQLSRQSSAPGRAWLESQTAAMLRRSALPQAKASQAQEEILAAVEAALADPVGQWLLAQHPDAQSEASWTGWLDGSLRTLRADRIFRAGSEILSSGTDYLWIVDYKAMQYSGHDVTGFLSAQREQYAPQLALYGQALRKIHGGDLRLRFALYFPRISQCVSWGTTETDVRERDKTVQ